MVYSRNCIHYSDVDFHYLLIDPIALWDSTGRWQRYICRKLPIVTLNLTLHDPHDAKPDPNRPLNRFYKLGRRLITYAFYLSAFVGP